MKIEDTIIRFLKKQTCSTICCINDKSEPHCFSCYYAFQPAEGMLYFKSSIDTEHGRNLTANRAISGTVLPDSLNKLVVKGIQLQGIVVSADNVLSKNAGKHYYARHPLAVAMKGIVYTIRVDFIKMTDSTAGFGKKIKWEREPEKNDIIKTELIDLNLN